MSILPNTVINGDCLEVMKEIAGESIDMIFCDLPYGVSQNKWDTIIPPPHFGNSTSGSSNPTAQFSFSAKTNSLPQ